MSVDFGIKVSKPGHDVKTAVDKNLAFSSKFQTLHIHSRGSGTVTDSGGRTVTISHGLGYVPKFLVHTQLDSVTSYGDANSYFISPYSIDGAGVSNAVGDRIVRCWADTSNLYIKFGDGFGYKEFHTGRSTNNYATDVHGIGTLTGEADFTRLSGVTEDGAVRFETVTVAQGTSIYKAELRFYIAGTTGSGNKPVKVYAIDEDNTADFGGSPFGRALTTAFSSPTIDSGLTSGYWTETVTGAVQEVINRSGWSSGNALGIIIYDNGSTGTDNQIYDDASGTGAISNTYLGILLSNTLASYKYTIFLDKIIP